MTSFSMTQWQFHQHHNRLFQTDPGPQRMRTHELETVARIRRVMESYGLNADESDADDLDAD